MSSSAACSALLSTSLRVEAMCWDSTALQGSMRQFAASDATARGVQVEEDTDQAFGARQEIDGPSARFSLFSQARAFSSDATIESSERNSRTKSAPSSHSFLAGSSRYFSANILETVGSLTPRVAATLDWFSARARAARITALVRTLRRSGAACGEGLLCAMISLERILLIYF